jgi:hypothetical protein
MGAAVAITRMTHDVAQLRRLAAMSDDAARARRLLAIAMILEGASRLDAARCAGMDRQTPRDWVHRYNEDGVEGFAPADGARQPSRQCLHLRRDLPARGVGAALILPSVNAELHEPPSG